MENLKKLSSYIETLNIEQNCWVQTPDKRSFINVDLSELEVFYGKKIIKLDDFVRKLSLFSKTEDGLTKLTGDIDMFETHVTFSDGNKKLSYPFTRLDIKNNTIMKSGKGADGTVLKLNELMPERLEKMTSGKCFTLSLTKDKYDELLKLNNEFKSTNKAGKNVFSLVIRDMSVYFSTKMESTANFEVKIGNIDNHDTFSDRTFIVAETPHKDSWDITFFDEIHNAILWEVGEGHLNFKMLMS